MESDADAAENVDEVDKDEVTEVSTKGRPGLFLALTCGFLVCMCCVGVSFAGVTLGLTRMANLERALGEVGAPDGWTTRDTTVWPWSAEARLSGPADAAGIATWLDEAGARTSRDEVAGCLSDGEKCSAELTARGFSVMVDYDATGDKADATVLIA